jgi:hypothetical protein
VRPPCGRPPTVFVNVAWQREEVVPASGGAVQTVKTAKATECQTHPRGHARSYNNTIPSILNCRSFFKYRYINFAIYLDTIVYLGA